MTTAPEEGGSVPTNDVAVTAVVVGAGGAGMMAALVAARRGVDVMLVEKSVHQQCNTELSGGLVQGAGSRYQQALGIEDSPERMLGDIMGVNGGKAEESVLRAICERSAAVVEFLADVVGLEMHLDTTVQYVGHSTNRMHTTPGERGSELVAGLRRAVHEERRITFADHANVQGLRIEDGTVVGIVAGEGGAEKVGAASVCLSCDGFGGNAEMVARYCPGISGANYIGSDNNTGDGIRWGIEAGAALDRMSAYQAHSHINASFGTRLGGALPIMGSIMVDGAGRRFAREDQGYSEFAEVLVKEAGGEAVEIFDQAIFDMARQTGSFRDASEAGAIRRGDDVGALAEAFGLDADVLADELADYNDAVRRAKPDRFGRSDLPRTLEPPYHGSRVSAALVHTQGGLRIDDRCRVLREDRRVIPGLLAAGGTAAGISGDGPDGYMSGNGLIQAFATGMIAGEQLAALAG
ncbi:MAG: FAD-dependent oxidoreductase [Acidimicrobiales bacterium]